MFLCKNCHNHKQHFGAEMESFGPCEICGKVKLCIDCHRNICRPPKRPKRPKSVR